MRFEKSHMYHLDNGCRPTLEYIKSLLENNDRVFIEALAQQAQSITLQYFGRTISIYSPLYLSNYCDNRCVYCGFSQAKHIKRKRLTREEMRQEMKKISDTGVQNILLLTGESRMFTPLPYLKTAVLNARDFFPSISLEIYPLETHEYKELFEMGVDGVTIYQETYNQKQYQYLHKAGKKSDYFYRYETPQRIAEAGIPRINMGVLLGLSESTEDIHQLFLHLEQMEKKYPGVEYSLSFPRLIPMGDKGIKYFPVSDLMLIKLICITRILFPRVGINLSTRERPQMRDHAINMGVTKISAASKTTVGGYSQKTSDDDPQFDVMDTRSLEEISTMLNNQCFDRVLTDWRRF